MKRIAVMMSKGGVGKTTTTVNLAAALAEKGKRVLVVDCDVQGQVAKFLGVTPTAGLWELVSGVGGKAPSECVEPARTNLLTIAGGRDLLKLRNWISAIPGDGRATILLEKLKLQSDAIDFVLYDTAPGWDVMTTNVLLAADEVLVPVPLQGAAIDGLGNFLELFESAKELNPSLTIRNVVPVMYDKRTSLSKELLSGLKKEFKKKVSKPIHYSVRVAESAGFGKTIFEHDPNNVCSTDYRSLARRIINAKE